VFRGFTLTAALAVVTALAVPATSWADFSIRIQAGPYDQTAKDNSAASSQLSDKNNATGSIAVASGLTQDLNWSTPAGVEFKGYGGDLTTSALASSLTSQTTINNKTGSIQTITLTLTEDKLNTGPVGAIQTVHTALTVISGSATNAQLTTAFPGAGTTSGTMTAPTPAGGISAPPGFYEGFGSFTRTAAGPYTITQTFQFTLAAGASLNFTTLSELNAVPAPPAAYLALSALPFAGGFLRRRFRAAPTA